MLSFLAIQAEFSEFLQQLPDLSDKDKRQILERLFDARGGVWKCVVPVHKDGRALIVGAGWHNSYLFLAECFQETVVWDPDPLRLSILERLANLLGLKPRFESGALDDLLGRLPKQDLIVFEDSLSWIPSHPAGSSYKSQADLVEKASRLLTDRGECLVAVPNRLALDSLLSGHRGSSPEPARPHLAGASPRSVLNQNGAGTGDAQGCWVPSLLRAFRHSELRYQRLYFLYPSRESPGQILGWGNEEPSGEQHPLVRVLNQTGMGKYFFDSPVFVASKKLPQDSFLECLLHRMQEQLGLREVPKIRSNIISNENTIVFFLELEGDGKAVLKLPLCETSLGRVESDRKMIEKAHEVCAPEVRPLLPRVLCYDVLLGQPYFVRSYVPGVSASLLVHSREEYSRVVADAAGILLQWHQASHRVVQVTPEVCERHFVIYFRQARPYLPAHLGLLDEIQGFLQEACMGQPISLGLMHGDFHLNNLMIDPAARRISGILDWDMGEMDGLPMLDLFHLLVSKERGLRDWGIGEAFNKVLLPNAFDPEERQLVEEFRCALGISEQMFLCLKIAYWARHCLGNLIQSGGLEPPKWMQENVFNVLENLRQTICEVPTEAEPAI
jgi:aminoglycoside phosphotransferase (APT) family kinase protein